MKKAELFQLRELRNSLDRLLDEVDKLDVADHRKSSWYKEITEQRDNLTKRIRKESKK